MTIFPSAKYNSEDIHKICEGLESFGTAKKEHIYFIADYGIGKGRRRNRNSFIPVCGRKSTTFCEKFYKSKYKRLTTVFENTVSFFEKHKDELADSRYVHKNLILLRKLAVSFSTKPKLKMGKLWNLIDSINNNINPSIEHDTLEKAKTICTNAEQDLVKAKKETEDAEEQVATRLMAQKKFPKMLEEYEFHSLESHRKNREQISVSFRSYLSSIKQAAPSDIQVRFQHKTLHLHSTLLKHLSTNGHQFKDKEEVPGDLDQLEKYLYGEADLPLNSIFEALNFAKQICFQFGFEKEKQRIYDYLNKEIRLLTTKDEDILIRLYEEFPKNIIGFSSVELLAKIRQIVRSSDTPVQTWLERLNAYSAAHINNSWEINEVQILFNIVLVQGIRSGRLLKQVNNIGKDTYDLLLMNLKKLSDNFVGYGIFYYVALLQLYDPYTNRKEEGYNNLMKVAQHSTLPMEQVNAMHNIGLCLIVGLGVKKDVIAGLKTLCKAYQTLPEKKKTSKTAIDIVDVLLISDMSAESREIIEQQAKLDYSKDPKGKIKAAVNRARFALGKWHCLYNVAKDLQLADEYFGKLIESDPSYKQNISDVLKGLERPSLDKYRLTV